MSVNSRLVALLVTTNVITYAALVLTTRERAKQQHRYVALHNTMMYLIHVMEEQGIDLSEFDAIALQAIIEEQDAS
jgi:hypothetical protein